MDGREEYSRVDGPLSRGSGVIRHNQTQVLSPNATVGVMCHSKRLLCHILKIQKNSAASHM